MAWEEDLGDLEDKVDLEDLLDLEDKVDLEDKEDLEEAGLWDMEVHLGDLEVDSKDKEFTHKVEGAWEWEELEDINQ